MQLFSSWTGSDFLLFYTMLLGLATFAAWWLPAHLREPGRQGESNDLESIALLAGGRERMADSLRADLYVRGALVPADKGKLYVARFDADGYMIITDRSKDVIKSGGEWIGSIDIENIAMAHPAVLMAACIAARHPKWDERPLLVVVRKPGEQVDEAALIEHCRAHLAGRHPRVPADQAAACLRRFWR